MNYKGYSATIEADTETGFLHGRVVGISEIIVFEGETVPQIIDDFRNAVDDYLADCAQRNVKPTTPASGKHPLKIPPLLHSVAREHARVLGKTFNAYVTDLIEKDITTSTDIPVGAKHA
ncbi:MAG: type II toxin-antitoxin system HicB family antitoxin [Pseudomonadota bacterium]